MVPIKDRPIKEAEYHADPALTIPTNKFRDRVAQIVLLKQQGKTNKEVAEELGLAVSTIQSAITKARKAGMLQLYSPADILENEIVPKVVDNINHFLDAKDRIMTVEAAKGLGIFKSHQAVKVEGGEQRQALVLNIQFEAPADPTVIKGGRIIGTPKLKEAEIVNE